jgi:hypothetical protein
MIVPLVYGWRIRVNGNLYFPGIGIEKQFVSSCAANATGILRTAKTENL